MILFCNAIGRLFGVIYRVKQPKTALWLMKTAFRIILLTFAAGANLAAAP